MFLQNNISTFQYAGNPQRKRKREGPKNNWRRSCEHELRLLSLNWTKTTRLAGVKPWMPYAPPKGPGNTGEGEVAAPSFFEI